MIGPERHDPDYARVLAGIEADGDLILTDVFADAEAQRTADRKIRRFEAQQARRRMVRRLARWSGVLLVLAALLVIVWLFVAALHPHL